MRQLFWIPQFQPGRRKRPHPAPHRSRPYATWNLSYRYGVNPLLLNLSVWRGSYLEAGNLRRGWPVNALDQL